MKWIPLLLLALLSGLNASAVTAAPETAGSEHYQAGRFEEAARVYRSLIDSGVREAAVFYNLGNCEHRQGHPGQAVLNYRRAQHLDPADADIEANLRFVQEQARVEPTPPPGTLRRLLLSAPANVWVCASMIGWWGGLILIAATRWRKARMPAGLLAFFAVLLVAGTTATALYLTPGGRGEAVAMQPAIARFSPLETAEPHFQLAPGAICLLEPRQGVAGWLQVRSGDKTGWVPSDRVAKVELE